MNQQTILKYPLLHEEFGTFSKWLPKGASVVGFSTLGNQPALIVAQDAQTNQDEKEKREFIVVRVGEILPSVPVTFLGEFRIGKDTAILLEVTPEAV